jgi:hypothetical protein
MYPGSFANKPFPHISSQPLTFTMTMEFVVIHG